MYVLKRLCQNLNSKMRIKNFALHLERREFYKTSIKKCGSSCIFETPLRFFDLLDSALNDFTFQFLKDCECLYKNAKEEHFFNILSPTPRRAPLILQMHHKEACLLNMKSTILTMKLYVHTYMLLVIQA